MFFIARCAFWLGVVAWQLPWPPVDQDAPVAATSQALGRVAAAACLADAKACLDVAGAALDAQTPESRPIVAPANPRTANVQPTSRPRPTAKIRSADSLTKADLLPPWVAPRG